MLWNNVKTEPQRWAAAWLRRRGWVVFYLDPECRTCHTLCWLRMYQEDEARDVRDRIQQSGG